MSRASFEAVSRDATTDASFSSSEERRVGMYDVVRVEKRGSAVFFYEANGALADDAGFAHLPDGPVPELANGNFEYAEFRHLGDNWYAWTASW